MNTTLSRLVGLRLKAMSDHGSAMTSPTTPIPAGPNQSAVMKSSNLLNSLMEIPSAAHNSGASHPAAVTPDGDSPMNPVPNHVPMPSQAHHGQMGELDGNAPPANTKDKINANEPVIGLQASTEVSSALNSIVTASVSDTRPDTGDVAPAGERDPGFPVADVNASPAQPAQPAKVGASTSPPVAAEGASSQQAGAGAANSPYAGYQNSNTVSGNRDTGEDSPNNVHGAANLPGEDGSAESPAKSLRTEQSEEQTIGPAARSIARPESGAQKSIANEGVSAMKIVSSPSGGSPSHFDGTDPKQQSQPNALDHNLSALETSQAGLPDLLEPTDGRVVQSTIVLDSKAVGGGLGGIEVLSSNHFTRDGPEQLATADDPLLGEASGGGVVIETLAIAPGAQISSLGYIISAGSDLNPLVLSTDASVRLENASEPTVREVSGGGVAFGTLRLPPGAQFTSMGHIVSAASGVVIIDGTCT